MFTARCQQHNEQEAGGEASLQTNASQVNIYAWSINQERSNCVTGIMWPEADVFMSADNVCLSEVLSEEQKLMNKQKKGR